MKLSPEVLMSVLQRPVVDYKKKNYYSICPYCGGDEFGISIYEENHPFGCFRKKHCGETGNIYKLLIKLGREDLLRDRKVNVNIFNKIEDDEVDGIDYELPNIKLPLGFQRIYADDYLTKRGFEKKDFEYFEVGKTIIEYSLKNYLIFVIREEGKVKGYVARSKFSKSWHDRNKEKAKKELATLKLRYNNSKTDFSKMVYNIDNLKQGTETAIIVEGVTDVRGVVNKLNLYDSNELGVVGTFGGKVSPAQVYKIKNKGVKKLILLFESDIVRTIKKLAYELEKHFEVLIGDLPDGHDPDDLDCDSLLNVLDNLKTPFEYYLYKMSA